MENQISDPIDHVSFCVVEQSDEHSAVREANIQSLGVAMYRVNGGDGMGGCNDFRQRRIQNYTTLYTSGTRNYRFIP